MSKKPYEELEKDNGRLKRRYGSMYQATEAQEERIKKLEGLLTFYQDNNAALAAGKGIAVDSMTKALTDFNATLQAYAKDIHLLEDKLKASEARVEELEAA